MLTTVTPGAQLLRLEFTAVVPPAAIPYPIEVGTAITTPGTRPPTMLTKAASIPATTIEIAAVLMSPSRSSSRQIPATPMSFHSVQLCP